MRTHSIFRKKEEVVVADVKKAERLPEGYLWIQFPDGTGFLLYPDNRTRYHYDLAEGLFSESPDDDTEISQLPKVNGVYDLDAFKEQCETVVRAEIGEIGGGGDEE